ncbi:MAG: hypothetical protein NVSMB9_15140 [Isosphaeraceae bacterium]
MLEFDPSWNGTEVVRMLGKETVRPFRPYSHTICEAQACERKKEHRQVLPETASHRGLLPSNVTPG